MLIILSPHSINSDIHFVQGLLSLGCQKNIKAGSTRGKNFQMAVTALGLQPHFISPSYTGRERAQWAPIRGLENPPPPSGKRQTFWGKEETEAISTGTRCHAVVWSGQWLLPFKQLIHSSLSRSHWWVDDCSWHDAPPPQLTERKVQGWHGMGRGTLTPSTQDMTLFPVKWLLSCRHSQSELKQD